MALLPPNLDYTDRDKASIVARLQALLASVFPTWTDYNRAAFGNFLLESFAWVGDNLAFYQDNNAQESRWSTATLRSSLLSLVKMIDYTPSGATAAKVVETFTLTAVPAADVTIPKGSTVRTSAVGTPIVFQLLSDLTIHAHADPPMVTATVENSSFVADTFASTGLANQTFRLTQSPYLDDSASPVATDGTYTQVDNFLDSGSADMHFTIVVDSNGVATIAFGNGTNGKIPVGAIAVSYKTGGGAGGNVEANTVNQIDGTFQDALGNPVVVLVTNAGPAAPGAPAQSVASIKELAPQSLRVLSRAVAREDFEIVAQDPKNISGVARALFQTSDEDPAIPQNSGILYVVPVGGGAPSPTLLSEVTDLFKRRPGWTPPFPCLTTFRFSAQAPNYLVVNVVMVVWFGAGVQPVAGANAIRAALATYFAPQNADGTPNTTIDWGFHQQDADGNLLGTIAIEDVIGVAKGVSGVLRVGGKASDFTLNGQHQDLPILSRQFPALGTVTVINGVNGAQL